MCLLQLALVVQHVESEANDPIPEEEGIFVHLVSLTARPRSRGDEALESLHGRAGLSGCAGCSQQAVKFFLADRIALACAFFEARSI